MATEEEVQATHYANVQIGEEEGLAPIYTVVSNPGDWDRYEPLQWYAVDEFVRNNPDEPDPPEVEAIIKRHREMYLSWGRERFGWGIHVFRNPA